MIVTITGLPGNGKTLYALNFVKDWAATDRRPVWYHGINKLNKQVLPWHELPVEHVTLKSDREGKEVDGMDIPQWWDAPKGSIVVIDEAQNCGFGVRGRGDVPPWARKLETHRHLGIDIVFITQNPTLIDAHDRKLSERHFHVMRKFGMQRAVIHEFKTGVRDNVEKSAVRRDSIKHAWKFPKASFAWYTSAEAHTHKRHVPMRVWVLMVLPFLIASIGWATWHYYLDPHRVRPGLQPDTVTTSSGVRAAAPSAKQAKLTTVEWVAEQQPRIQGLAYTAPTYDEITKPVVAPYPAACVAMGTRCSCYSQQGTQLDTADALCRSIVQRGFFVAWQQPAPPQQAQPQMQPVAFAQPGGAVVIGQPSRQQVDAGARSTIDDGYAPRAVARSASASR